MGTKTNYYELTKPDGEDFYNVADFNGNADIIDREMKYLEDKAKSVATDISELKYRAACPYRCTKSGTVFSMIPQYIIRSDQNLILCMFKAPADYQKGDTFQISGVDYTAVTQDGGELPHKAFAQNAVVMAVVCAELKTINFKLAGGGESFPAETPPVVRVFVESGTFKAPVTGRYRVTCIGKGGDGNDGHAWDASCDYAVNGAGGGAGGAAAVTLSLTKGDSYPVTVDTGISSFGALVSGSAGEKGRFTPPYTISGGEAGYGTATGDGGAYIGLPGQLGEQSNLQTPTERNPSDGGDGGGYVPNQSRFFPLTGGTGGKMPQSAVDGIAPTTFVKMGGGRGLFPESLSPAGMFPFGAGGGGGMYYDGYGYLGGKGSFGAVIVEYLSN